MRIKEAAAQSGLTEKAIRLYEERGLLVPDITEHGGRKFRDYNDAAVHTLKIIAVLRQASFSLEQISGMQKCPAEIPAIFSRYREELHARHEKDTVLIARADAVAPEALTGIDELSAALHDPAETIGTDADGPSLFTEEAQKAGIPPAPEFHFLIWDEHADPQERIRAHRKYLSGHTRWEVFYDLHLRLSGQWLRIRRPFLCFVLPAALLLLLFGTMPWITKVEGSIDGYELFFDGGAWDADVPDRMRPLSMQYKGNLYRYLFRRDHFQGEIAFDRYGVQSLKDPAGPVQPHAFFRVDLPLSRPGTLAFTVPGLMMPFTFSRLVCEETGQWIWAGSVSPALQFLFQTSGNGTAVSFLIFPAAGRAEALSRFYAWVFEPGKAPT